MSVCLSQAVRAVGFRGNQGSFKSAPLSDCTARGSVTPVPRDSWFVEFGILRSVMCVLRMVS